MFDQIPEDKARKLIENNISYLAIIEALRTLNAEEAEGGLTDEELERNHEIGAKLNKDKEKLYKEKDALEREAMENMLTTSFVPLVDGWYAVAYFTDKKHAARKLYFVMLPDYCNFEAIRDHVNRYDGEHPKDFLTPYMDKEKFGSVFSKIKSMGQALAEGGSLGEDAYLSEHAKQRYEERSGSDIADATDDLKAAELVYETSGTKYYLNKDSMLFYCVKNGVVATCYRHDFGFHDPEIHAKIVFMLIDRLRKMKAECAEKTENIEKKKKDILKKEEKANEELAKINLRRKDLLNAAKMKKEELKGIARQISNCNAALSSIEDEIRGEEALLLSNVKIMPVA